MHAPTNLFLPRLRAWSLSAAVGSGKTRAAIAWMAGPDTARRNVLYVAPTLKLLSQTEAGLRAAIAEAKGSAVRNVNLISRENAAGRVEVEALLAINEAEAFDGRVQMLTTATFLSIVSRITRPELWSVVCDEAFEPATFTTFQLGTDVARGWAHFTEAFRIDPEQGYRILPAPGKASLVAEVARGDFRSAGDRFQPLQEAACAVANPAVRCELVMTDGAKALVAGEVPECKGDKVARLEFSSYIDPAAFCGFREVLFLAALFERTILYALWTKALGVTFASHPDFPAHMLRDTHAEQGRFLAVGHLLAKGDSASLENLKRDALTGETSSAIAGHPESVKARTRVIDVMVTTSAAHFGNEPFLLQTNPRFGYEEHSSALPRTAVWIPPVSHGRNDFAEVDNVAAFFVRNPNTQQLQWVKERTGMTSEEATLAFRIHSVYQALGRCSIRKAVPCDSPKVVLTAGLEDAEFLRDLFPGSHWMGQVGTLPPLSSLKAKGTDRIEGKEALLVRLILEALDSLDPSVLTIKSTDVRVMVETRNAQALLNLYGASERFAPATWRRATAQACVLGRSWQRQGQSLARITAELYGFTQYGFSDQSALA